MSMITVRTELKDKIRRTVYEATPHKSGVIIVNLGPGTISFNVPGSISFPVEAGSHTNYVGDHNELSIQKETDTSATVICVTGD